MKTTIVALFVLLGLVATIAPVAEANSVAAVRSAWIDYVGWWDPPVLHYTGHVAPSPSYLPFSKDVTLSQVENYLTQIGVNASHPSCSGDGLITSGCPHSVPNPDTGLASYYVCDCSHVFLTYVTPQFW